MSVNPCTPGPTCPGGNCAGCRGGNLYCNDPRCYPNCPNCNTSPTTTTTTTSSWWLVMIILILAILLLIFLFIMGYDYWNKHKAAMEPKNVIVNKHIHSVKGPPPVVVSQAQPQMIVSQAQPPVMLPAAPAMLPAAPAAQAIRQVAMPAPPAVVVSQPSLNNFDNVYSEANMNAAIMPEPNYLARVPNRVNCEGMALGMDEVPGCGLPSNQQVEGFE